MSMKASKSSSGKSKKSSSSSRNASCASPRKRTSGYDFCSRVEKCCINWHESVIKWENLNKNGLELATKIVNTHLEKTSQETHVDEAQQETTSHLNFDENELEKDKEKLVQIFYSLKEVLEKMSSLTSNFEAIASLHEMKFGKTKKDEPIFETWPINNYVVLSAKLSAMFSKELSLKEKLVGMVVRESNEQGRTKLMACLATWLHQPYLEEEYRQELEIMLIETGLKAI